MDVGRHVAAAVEKALRTGRHVGIVVGVLFEDERRIFAFGRISQTLKKPPPSDALFEIGSHAPRARAGGGLAVGLGWHISPLGARDPAVLHWHNGGTGGFSSFVGFVKARRLGLVVLSNASSEVDSLAYSLLSSLLP